MIDKASSRRRAYVSKPLAARNKGIPTAEELIKVREGDVCAKVRATTTVSRLVERTSTWRRTRSEDVDIVDERRVGVQRRVDKGRKFRSRLVLEV